jgi:uncharacterized protein YlxP (DUF503 family)
MSLKKDTQRQILIDLAKKYNISIAQADEIWKLFEDKIIEVISEENKLDENDLYDVNNVKIIHIDNFGKFIPDTKLIGIMNNHRKNKFKKNGTSLQ